ncbi:MAG: hypothetical protein HWD58_04050 [Bacteroidota bacterium]|nr:MAG: hypothetical protein HWD58_04050 [Bacteroidota bacterium]
MGLSAGKSRDKTNFCSAVNKLNSARGAPGAALGLQTLLSNRAWKPGLRMQVLQKIFFSFLCWAKVGPTNRKLASKTKSALSVL